MSRPVMRRRGPGGAPGKPRIRTGWQGRVAEFPLARPAMTARSVAEYSRRAANPSPPCPGCRGMIHADRAARRGNVPKRVRGLFLGPLRRYGPTGAGMTGDCPGGGRDRRDRDCADRARLCMASAGHRHVAILPAGAPARAGCEDGTAPLTCGTAAGRGCGPGARRPPASGLPCPVQAGADGGSSATMQPSGR